ncbi:Glucose-6-phosphate/phosphate translocator 2, chloroplastic [Galdieria sulphuraria]|nr:Glucose-6-phosphate/phosphate translocator 2, chloroplastic [Galdieria sulphuraria]
MDFRKTLKHSLNHFVFISSHSIWKSTNECVFKDKYALRRWSCPMRKFDWITRQYLVAKARRLPQFYCLANTSLDEPSKESIKVTEASQPSQNTASWKRQLKVASYFFLCCLGAIGSGCILYIKRLLPVAAAHTIGHISTVVSLGAVAISFTHVVKALEPFVNVLASAVILRSVFPIPVYLSLLPVVGGVIIASVTELSFTWTGFMAAMLSNFAFTSRNIFSKISMNDQTSYKHMSPANLFAVLTILSTFILLPVALILEGPKLYQGWILATSGKTTSMQLITGLLTSGLFFYLYNEVAFYALDSVHPITHSNPITPANAIGSAIAISGVLLYSLTKYYYSQKIK